MFSSTWSPPKVKYVRSAWARKKERRKKENKKWWMIENNIQTEDSELEEKGNLNLEIIKESFDFHGKSFKDKLLESLVTNSLLSDGASELKYLYYEEEIYFEKFQNHTSLIPRFEEFKTEFQEFVCEKGPLIYKTNSFSRDDLYFYFMTKCYVSLEKYKFLPPLEYFLKVSPSICEQQFYASLSAGDILFGKVIEYQGADTHVLQIIARGGYHHRNLIGTNIKAQLQLEDCATSDKMFEINSVITVEVLHTLNIMNGRINPGGMVHVGTKGDVLQRLYYNHVLPNHVEQANKFVLGKIDSENNKNTFPSILYSIESNEVNSYDECLTKMNLDIHSKSKHKKLCKYLNFRTDYCQSLMNIDFSNNEAETLKNNQNMNWIKEALDNESIYENKEYVEEIIKSFDDGSINRSYDMIICRAKFYKNLSRYKDALHSLNHLPDHHKLKKSLNVDILLEYARERETTENFLEARQLCRKCLEIDPGNEEAKQSIERLKLHKPIISKDQDIEELDNLLQLREDINESVQKVPLESLSSLEALLEAGLVVLDDKKRYKCQICDVYTDSRNIHLHLSGKSHAKKAKLRSSGEVEEETEHLRDDIKMGLKTGLLKGIPTNRQWLHEKTCWYHNYTKVGCHSEAESCDREHNCSICNKTSHGSRNCSQMWNLWSTKIENAKLSLSYESMDSITEDEVKEYFSQFGKVVACNIFVMEVDIGLSDGSFVEFEKSSEAEMALKHSKVHEIKGNVLHIKPAEYKFTKVLIGSRSLAGIVEEDLRECLCQFGAIVACDILKRADGSNRTYGFVEFEDPDAADKAAMQTEILEVKGNVLMINKMDIKYNKEKAYREKAKVGNYECMACGVTMYGLKPLLLHMDGGKHKNNVEQTNEDSTVFKEEDLPPHIKQITPKVFECTLCVLRLGGISNVNCHVNASKHKKKLKEDLPPTQPLEIKEAIDSGALTFNSVTNMYKCNYCESGDIPVGSQADLLRHLATKKHQYHVKAANFKGTVRERMETKSIRKPAPAKRSMWASAVIRVSSIPSNATEADVINFIGAFGRIRNVRMMLKTKEALLEMFEKEEAEAVIADHAVENLKILGKDIAVDFSEHGVLNENPISRVLYFENLPITINNSKLIELASQYGVVTGVKILECLAREGGRKALVEMFETDAAFNLINDLAKIQSQFQNVIVVYSIHDALHENAISRVLHFTNLPIRINNSKLIELASPYGVVTGVKILESLARDDGRKALVEMIDTDAALNLMNDLVKIQSQFQNVYVTYSEHAHLKKCFRPQGERGSGSCDSDGKFSGANTAPLLPRKTVSGTNPSPLLPQGNFSEANAATNASRGKFTGANNSPLVPRGNFTGANNSPLIPRGKFSGANAAPLANEIMPKHQLPMEMTEKNVSQPEYMIYGRRDRSENKTNSSEYHQKPAIWSRISDPLYDQHIQHSSSNKSLRAELVQSDKMRPDSSTDLTQSLDLSSGTAQEIKKILSSMGEEQKKIWEKRFDSHVKKMEQELEAAFTNPSAETIDGNFGSNSEFPDNMKRKRFKGDQEITSGSSSRDAGSSYGAKKQKILIEDEDSQDKSKYNMLVRGLSIDRTKQEIMEFFSDYGVIEDVLIEWSENPAFVGEQTAYIAFKRNVDVTSILNQHQNLFIKTSLISIHRYIDPSISNDVVILVRGISYANRDTKRELFDFFSMIGSIKTLFLNIDSRNGHYALITFNSREVAKKIVSTQKPYILNDDVLQLKEVKLLKEEKDLDKLEVTQQSLCVPSDQMSPLIRHSVSILKDIMQETGATYEFVLSQYTSINQTLTIHGTPEQIFSAKKLIKERLRKPLSNERGRKKAKDPPKVLIITESIYEVLESLCINEVDLEQDTCVRVLENMSLQRVFNAVSSILKEMINISYVVLVFGFHELTIDVNTSKGLFKVPREDDAAAMDNFFINSQDISERLQNQFRGVKFLWTTPVSYSFENYNRQQRSFDQAPVIPSGCWRNIQINFHKCLINLRIKMLQSDPHYTIDFLKLFLYMDNSSDGLSGEQMFIQGEALKENWFTQDCNKKLNEEGGRSLRYCIRKAVQRQILWGLDAEGKSEWCKYVEEMLYREQQEREYCQRDMQLLPLPNMEQIFLKYGAPVEQNSGKWAVDQRYLPAQTSPYFDDDRSSDRKRSWKNDQASRSYERPSHSYQRNFDSIPRKARKF